MATVLIVEDSRPMQRTLQRLFEADSLQVQIAPDGPSGLGEILMPQLQELAAHQARDTHPGEDAEDCNDADDTPAHVP